MCSRDNVQAVVESIQATAREESEESVVNHFVDDDSVEQMSGLPGSGGPSGPQSGGIGVKGRVVTMPRGRRRSREQRIRRSAAPGSAVLRTLRSQRGSGVAGARSLPAKSFFVASPKISRAGDHGHAHRPRDRHRQRVMLPATESVPCQTLPTASAAGGAARRATTAGAGAPRPAP